MADTARIRALRMGSAFSSACTTWLSLRVFGVIKTVYDSVPS